jgi:hypothetical protein
MYSVCLPLLLIIFYISVITIAYTPNMQSQTTITDTTTKNNDFLTYENSDHGLTVQYPANWDKEEGIPILNEILGVGNIVPFTPSINTDITFEMV